MVVYCTVDSSNIWQELCSGLDSSRVFETLEDISLSDGGNYFVKESLDVFEVVELYENITNIDINIVLIPFSLLSVEALTDRDNFHSLIKESLANRKGLLSFLRTTENSFKLLNFFDLSLKEISRIKFSLFDWDSGKINFKCDDATYLYSFYEVRKEAMFEVLDQACEVYGYKPVTVKKRDIDLAKFDDWRTDHVKKDEFEQVIKQLFIVQDELEKKVDLFEEKEKYLLKDKDNIDKQKTKEILKLKKELIRKKTEENELRKRNAEYRLYERTYFWKFYKKCLKIKHSLSKNKKNTPLENINKLYNSPYFDPDWYVFTYPDVASISVDPAEHYLTFGADEGRNPSKKFNTNWYLERYPDVKESRINPLIHFIDYGEQEKRLPLP